MKFFQFIILFTFTTLLYSQNTTRSQQINYHPIANGFVFSLIFEYKTITDSTSFLTTDVSNMIITGYHFQDHLYVGKEIPGINFPISTNEGFVEIKAITNQGAWFQQYFKSSTQNEKVKLRGKEQSIHTSNLLSHYEIISYKNEQLETQIRGLLTNTLIQEKGDFENFEEQEKNYTQQKPPTRLATTDNEPYEYGIENEQVGIESTSLGHILSLMGLSVDTKELQNAETAIYAKDAFKAQLQEIQAQKENFRLQYYASLDRLTEKKLDSKSDLILRLAGLLISTGSEVGRQAKLNREIKKLEQVYKIIIDKFHRDLLNYNKKGKDFALKQAAMAIAPRKEAYYIELINHHDCNTAHIRNNFSYQDMNWTESGCERPTQNFNFSYDFTTYDFLQAARRKNSYAELYEKQSLSNTHRSAFQESANYYLNKVLKEEEENAYAIFIRSEFRPNAQLRIKDIQKAHVLALENQEISDTLTNINNRYRAQYLKGIEDGNIEILKEIDSYGLAIKLINNNGIPPEMLAIKHDKPEILEYLSSEEDWLLFGNHYLIAAIRQNSDEVYKYLIETKRVDVNKSVLINNVTKSPIEVAYEVNSSKSFLFLTKKNASILPLISSLDLVKTDNKSINFSELVINTSIISNNKELFLLGLKARKPKEDELASFVKSAIENNRYSYITHLIKSGILIDYQDKQGKTFYHYACEFDKPSVIKELNILGGSSNITDTNGLAPIHYLTKFPSKEIQEQLHQLSFNLNQTNDEGETVVIQVIKKGQYHLAKTLLAQPKNIKIDIKNKEGDTPLHIAVKYNQYGIADLLLSAGANQTITNTNNKTPLDLAKEYKNKQMKKVLKSK